eukprot:1566819-Alexandrium_andersonii.AAC.1
MKGGRYARMHASMRRRTCGTVEGAQVRCARHAKSFPLAGRARFSRISSASAHRCDVRRARPQARPRGGC